MQLKHALLAVLVAVIWGVNFLAINATLQDVPPLLSLALRFLLVVFPWIFFVKPPKVGWRAVVAIGLTTSLGQFAILYLALSLGMPVGLAPLVLQAQVLFTALIAMAVLKERPSGGQLIGIGMGVLGLAIVGFGRAQVAPVLPFLLVLLAAACWAVGNVITRRVQRRSSASSSGLSMVIWSGTVVPVPMFVLSYFFEGPAALGEVWGNLHWPAILGALYTALISSLVGYGIWNNLLRRYPASAVGPYSLLIPVVGMASAWIVLREVPSSTELLGGALLLAGVAFAVVRFKKPTVPVKPSELEVQSLR
ncbi:O-acetylserine/cysteine efflux transporter [Psychromicrobium silvestre]|uniref:O-acetylserine/cysteine efflux transporter n=1 Tax=Psychromicrobium silvestre TaxID=1645614 RepID=A0A7Y9S8B9_9MICC|nr:EamA family transporter [Psychromicrobium silvestre]NYE95811.1 O-acetylserine/cysteine efflux transporter [Psychromicrobium silvestre]